MPMDGIFVAEKSVTRVESGHITSNIPFWSLLGLDGLSEINRLVMSSSNTYTLQS